MLNALDIIEARGLPRCIALLSEIDSTALDFDPTDHASLLHTSTEDCSRNGGDVKRSDTATTCPRPTQRALDASTVLISDRHNAHLSQIAATTRIESIGDNILVAGQITDSANTLNAIQTLGIKTVFNLRFASEKGYVDLGSKLAEMGIEYQHHPITYENPNIDDMDLLLGKLDGCAKPCLIFCQVGLRAAAMGIAFKSARHGAAMALHNRAEGKALIDEEDQKLLDGFCAQEHDMHLKAFVASYVADKVRHCVNPKSDVDIDERKRERETVFTT